jgi:hypothetical protein
VSLRPWGVSLGWLGGERGALWTPSGDIFLVAVDDASSTRPLGTPRGRCDAYISKFSLSKNPRFIEPVGAKKHVEG